MILVGAGVFFLSAQPVEEADSEIRIGVVGSFSGMGAYFGEQERRGVELAAEEINQNGGINGKRVKLFFEDDSTKDVQAVTALKKLVEVDQVHYVIGGSWNSTTAAMVPVANEKEVILISPVSVLSALSADDYFFRTVSSTQDMMVRLARYARDANIQTVSILATNTAFGLEHVQTFENEFERLGGLIVSKEMVVFDQPSVKTELAKIKSSNPDAILNLYSSGPPIGLPMKEAKELGIKTKWLTSFGGESQPLITEYGSIVEGMVYVYPYDSNDSSPAIQQFVQLYREKYQSIPDFSVVGAYDAMKLLAWAIEQSGDDAQKVKSFLTQVKNYSGASGLVSFDQNGDVKKEIIIKQIQNGSFVGIN